MKILKHLTLAALVTAGLLLPPAVTPPQPASANACDVLVNILSLGQGDCRDTTFGVDPTCSMQNVDAGGSTINRHSYKFDVCGATIHVNAVYDVNTNTAQEELRAGSSRLQSKRACSSDPWTATNPPSCGDGKLSSNTTAAFDLPDLDLNLPVSSQYLTADSRDTLLAALNDAMTQSAIDAVNQAAKAEAARQAEAAKQAAIRAALFTNEITLAGSGAVAYFPTPVPQPIAYHDPSIGADGWPQLSKLTQGEAVKSLQYLLQGQDQALPVSGVDGKFWTETDAAVRAFQKAQGLTADGAGVVGQQTWQALIVTVDYTVPPDTKVTAAVKAVQSQLKFRGFLAAAVPVDGVFGPSEGLTYNAVRAYQQAHPPLAIDGQVGPKTWQSLLAGS